MHCLETTKMFPISEAEGLITKQASMGLKGPHTQLTHSSRCLEQSELVFLGCPLSQVTYCFILLKASTILETGFFLAHALYFLHVFIHIHVFLMCVFVFWGLVGFAHRSEALGFIVFLFCLFVCFSIFSSLTFSLHNIHD